MLAFLSLKAQDTLLVSYVRPLVGTSGYGNTYPGSQIPFGGIQISPDTDFDFYDAASGYKYDHSTLLGFSLTHLSGTGIPDLGDFLFIPGTGKIHFTPGTHENPDDGYRSRYSHEREWAFPNYYAVDLLDYDVKAEMTSGVRSGMLRFTYPESDSAFILLDLNHTLYQQCPWSNIRIENDSTLTAYKLVQGWGPERHVYLTAVFSRPFEDFGIMQDTVPVIYNTKRFRSHLEAWGKNLCFWMSFSTLQDEQITVKVAISAVSTDGAKLNMQELAGKTFETLKTEGEQLWEKQLAKFRVEGTQQQKETFYTSVYHAFLHPFIFQDADGHFRELDKNIGHAEEFTNYTVFSLWDAVEGFSTGEVTEHFDASLHTIRFSDMMVEPEVWTGTASSPYNDGAESGLWGAFSRKKLEMICERFDLTYSDFMSTETMPMVLQTLISTTMSEMLIERYNAKDPVLEDDGQLMYFGSCPWKSWVGVAWIPEEGYYD